jgi:hypothetical protein
MVEAAEQERPHQAATGLRPAAHEIGFVSRATGVQRSFQLA